MIVVVGDGLVWTEGRSAEAANAGTGNADQADGRAAGRATEIASAAAQTGASVQVVSKVGDDPTGDAIVLSLGRQGIGHVAILRDAASSSLVKAPAESNEIEDLAPEAELSAALNDDDPAGVGAGAASAPVTPVRTLGPKLEPADLELALRYLSSFGVIVTATPLPEAALAVIAEAAAYNGAQLVVVSEGGEAQASIEGATVLQAPADDPDHRFAKLVGRYAAGLDGGLDPATAFGSASEALGWETASPA